MLNEEIVTKETEKLLKKEIPLILGTGAIILAFMIVVLGGNPFVEYGFILVLLLLTSHSTCCVLSPLLT